jgi:hypothetical protein
MKSDRASQHHLYLRTLPAPRLATSSWYTKLDPEIYCRIGISRSNPRGQAGFRRYAALNPGGWFSRVDATEFRKLYYQEVLDELDPARVVRDLEDIADGKTAVLCCFEPPETGPRWCHRGFVSEWLFNCLGVEVYEIGMESFGSGCQHPKLPFGSAEV